MTRCLNRAELIGNLGDAPDLRMLDTGQAMATFSVATSWRWQDAEDATQEATEWSRCVVFGPLAEYCGAALTKGSRVYVRGRLRTRSWEDTGAIRRERTEIVVQEVVDLDAAQGAARARGAAGHAPTPPATERAPPRTPRRR